MTELTARAAAWRDADPDLQTRAELDRLLVSGDTAALAERFDGSLAFGTAGIRAEIGAGPMRMNRMVVGCDGRIDSAVFATDAARASAADQAEQMMATAAAAIESSIKGSQS
jgi:hypothetical protein